MNGYVRVSFNQSLFDISIQECGSIEAVFDLADLNGLEITATLEPGQLLKTPPSTGSGNGYNKPIVDYYKMRGLMPATGLFDGDGSGGGKYKDDGIDYMAIEVDNIVT
jgi:hypothetical protein